MANAVEITAADGHKFDARRADPSGAAKGGIVVLHAIYGLTTHMGDVCDLYAGHGYAAIAPALYDRSGKNLVFSYEGEGRDAGMAQRETLTEPTVLLDVGAVADALRPSGRVAISGFCTGGTWAWVSGAKLDFDAEVNFYGSDVYDLRDLMPACPAILHYGDQDVIVPIDQVETIRSLHAEQELHVYPGQGHAFFNPEQASHDAASAALALERSIAFMNRHLAGE